MTEIDDGVKCPDCDDGSIYAMGKEYECQRCESLGVLVCEGHPNDGTGPIGTTIYCDGTCRLIEWGVWP